MTVSQLRAVGLLERSVGYTGAALAEVTPSALGNPTPCRGWDLSQLLHHMDDALDAFIEAAAGVVDLAPVPPSAGVVDRLRLKACGLLGAWSTSDAESILVGDQRLPSGLLVSAAALEIALHGWDVGQATGRPAPLPDDLAGALVPVARAVVTTADRPGRFGPQIPQSPSATPAEELLGFCGRYG